MKRSPFDRLWIRLLAAFMLVAAVAVGVVAVLANRTTTRQFEIYVSQGKQARAQLLVPEFAAYYAQTGSWQDVGTWMEDSQTLPTTARGQGRGQGRGQTAALDRLLLADADGRIVADSESSLVGERLSAGELDLGTPIEVGGERVGTLLIPAAESVHVSQEDQFLEQVNRTLVWAGLAAAGVALVLGLLLARQLTAPLRSLTQASHQLAEGPRAAGKNPPHVEVRSGDEIGELAQAFNAMSDSLARQETLRRNLMADIAHELRTPLTVMRGDLEALLDGVFEPSPENLASLQEETLMLSRLVDDLRALALAEAGQLQLEREPTDLTDLLRGVVAGFDLQAEMQGQTLSLEVASGLPEVYADPQRIRQVVANLVSNALRHAPDSGGVAVSARSQPGEVLISVKDDGPGIGPEELPHVFDRFWRGGRPRTQGSGLGLAISQELVRAHGGRIWVESEPGHGSEFSFCLPV